MSPLAPFLRLGAVLALVAILVPAGAFAAERTDADPMSEPGAEVEETTVDADAEERPVRVLIGFKVGGGGELWTAPDDAVLGTDPVTGAEFSLPLFDETRAGFMYGGGLFVEGIFYEHFGVEVGFHFLQHTLLEEIDWTFTEQRGQEITTFESKSKQELSWLGFHLPILFKGIVKSGKTRVSLGVGPEFEFTMGSSASFEITKGEQSTDPNDGTFPLSDCYDGKLRLAGTRCEFQRVGVKEENSVYLTVVFGIEITADEHWIVPIDIHWSYNFSQDKKYTERVVIDPNTIPSPSNPDARPTGVDLKTRDSMYGGLRVGLAYRF